MGRKIPDTLSEEELVKVLKVTKNDKHKLAYLLAFYQGLRVSEIVGLRKPISRCCRALIRKERETWQDKWGKQRKRTHYLCSKCGKEWTQQECRRHKTEWQIHPLQKKNVFKSDHKIEIKGAKGDKDRNITIIKPLLLPEQTVVRALSKLPISIGIRALESSFKKQCKNLLGRDLHFHCLRHSCGTWLINKKKWDVRHVQQFLGHSKIATTEIYTHVTPKHLVELEWGESK